MHPSVHISPVDVIAPPRGVVKPIGDIVKLRIGVPVDHTCQLPLAIYTPSTMHMTCDIHQIAGADLNRCSPCTAAARAPSTSGLHLTARGAI